MGVVSEAEFERMLADLDREAFGDFVADLWRARGWKARREEGAVVVRDGDVTRRIRLVTRSRRLRGDPVDADGDGDADVDCIASATDSAAVHSLGDRLDARVLGPADLRDALLYAVEREEGERLARRHFGETLVRETPESADSMSQGESPDGALSGGPVDGRTAAATLSVCLLLVAVAVAAGSGALLGPSDRSAGFDVTVTFAEYTQPRSVTPQSQSTDADGEQSVLASPPGVSLEGVTDAEALAAAHTEFVRDDSYHLSIVYDGVRGAGGRGPVYRLADEQIAVGNETRFRRSLRGRIQTRNGSIETVNRAVYADGQFRYVRESVGAMTYERTRVDADRVDEFSRWIGRYIVRFLTTSESAVTVEQTGGNATWHVVATGRPARLSGIISNYRAEATVSGDGFVRRLRVTFEREGATRKTRFAFAYSARSEATVSPPEWYDEAVSATAGNETANATTGTPGS